MPLGSYAMPNRFSVLGMTKVWDGYESASRFDFGQFVVGRGHD